MRIPVRERGGALRFNITPMIDVVFLLIIFFLVASHFVRADNVEPVQLPDATQGKPDDQNPRRITITVTEDEKLHVSGRVIEPAALERLLLSEQAAAGEEPFEVRIRADRRVPYRVVEPILLEAAEAGITRVRFAVNNE